MNEKVMAVIHAGEYQRASDNDATYLRDAPENHVSLFHPLPVPSLVLCHRHETIEGPRQDLLESTGMLRMRHKAGVQFGARRDRPRRGRDDGRRCIVDYWRGGRSDRNAVLLTLLVSRQQRSTPSPC